MIVLLKIVIVLLIALGFGLKAFKIKNDNDDNENYALYEVRWVPIISGIVMVIIAMILLSGLDMITTGERGVVLRMGAMTGKTLNEGVYYVTPLVDNVEVMSVQVSAYKSKATAASKDMQEVHTEVTLNYQLDEKRVGSIYRELRRDYEVRVISPAIQESMKAATAKFDAENLIGNRESVRAKIKELLVVKLENPYGVIVRDVSITNFNFSPEFNAAIEQKATAVQRAETAKRDFQRIITEQKGKIEIAKAQAESLRLQKQNVTPELVKLRQIELGEKQNEMMKEKWNGVLPTWYHIGGGSPNVMVNAPVPGG